MANLPPQTVVAKGECADCGKAVPIKLNKNGIAYYFCQWPDTDGERCSHHQKWGRVQSQKMQSAYLKFRKDQPEETDHERRPEPADILDKPQTGNNEREPEREGFLCG